MNQLSSTKIEEFTTRTCISIWGVGFGTSSLSGMSFSMSCGSGKSKKSRLFAACFFQQSHVGELCDPSPWNFELILDKRISLRTEKLLCIHLGSKRNLFQLCFPFSKLSNIPNGRSERNQRSVSHKEIFYDWYSCADVTYRLLRLGSGLTQNSCTYSIRKTLCKSKKHLSGFLQKIHWNYFRGGWKWNEFRGLKTWLLTFYTHQFV